jgi:DNA-binding protein HU-beta
VNGKVLQYTNNERSGEKMTPVKGKAKVMGKKEVIEAIAKQTKLSKKDTEITVDAFWKTIRDSLKKNMTVRLIPYGNFEVRHRAARTGRNPRTGGKIQIKARNVPAFKAGKALKDAVQ